MDAALGGLSFLLGTAIAVTGGASALHGMPRASLLILKLNRSRLVSRSSASVLGQQKPTVCFAGARAELTMHWCHAAHMQVEKSWLSMMIRKRNGQQT